jgi:uncharacterized membrane protein YiaA
MVTFVTVIVLILVLVLNHFLFKKLINHLTLYAFSWALYIILYDLRLMNYPDIKSVTWFVILLTFFHFILGILTVFAARRIFNKNNDVFSEEKEDELPFAKDNGQVLKISIYFFGLIGLYAAYHHWMELIAKFGSITKVLLNANIIYSMRVSGEFEGSLPYLYTVAYVGVFLSAIYTALKERVTFVAIIPMIAVILKDTASVGRTGILFAFLLFFLTFLTTRYSISTIKTKKKLNRKGLIIGVIIIVLLAISAVSLIKTFRGQIETYTATSRSLNKFKNSLFISPSLYLYFSSNPVVLNRYLMFEDENLMIGENTFLTFYNFISKFGVIDHPKFYPKGYFVPMWTNQATYLREIHADFGYFGVFTIPYIMGFLCTLWWFRYFETNNTNYLILYSFLNMVVSMGIMIMITRMAAFWIALIILLLSIPVIEKLSVYNYYRLRRKKMILFSVDK